METWNGVGLVRTVGGRVVKNEAIANGSSLRDDLGWTVGGMILDILDLPLISIPSTQSDA
jgi:hypothetical protein